VDVSEPASISTGIAARYAQAVLELSREGGDLAKLEQDVADLDAAIRESEDLSEVLTSPVISRAEQGAAVVAVAERMGLSETMRNVLALMASKRRLFVVPAMVRVLKDRLSAERGEVVAEVRSAGRLSDDQRARLAEALKSSTGKQVALEVTVDESLIGGLVVKVGSQMIDTSIRAKLNALQNTMKEVR
jgi:F-type H+-transporting ATPase subunit delta